MPFSDVITKAKSASAYNNGAAVIQPGKTLATPQHVNARNGSGVVIDFEARFTDRLFPDSQDVLKRDFREMIDVSLTTSAVTTPIIDFRAWAGGSIMVPAGSSITTLTFHASLADGSYHALQDGEGSAVTLTVAAGSAYPFPDACFGVARLKITADAAGVVDILLKG